MKLIFNINKTVPVCIVSLLLVLLAISCTSSDTSTASDSGSEVEGCTRTTECDNGEFCLKAEGAAPSDVGECIQIVCFRQQDCSETEKCDIFRGLCVPKSLCDPSNPNEVCAEDELCIYNDGQPLCVNETELPSASKCHLNGDNIVQNSGKSAMVSATAYQANGQILAHGKFSYSLKNLEGTAENGVVTAECVGDSVCKGKIVAKIGTVECESNLSVYPGKADGNFRVVLLEQGSNTALANVKAALKLEGSDALIEVTTDENGIALWSAAVLTSKVEAVSAFPDEHQWISILSPSSDDLSFFMSKVIKETEVAGVKGQFDFSQTSTQGDIEIGLAGLSIDPSVVDIDFNILTGSLARHTIPPIEGVLTSSTDTLLPDGLSAKALNIDIKKDVVALGKPGKSVLWTLGGRVPLSRLQGLISDLTSGEDLNVGNIMTTILPLFAKFDHGLHTGLDLELVNKPAQDEDKAVAFDDWNLPDVRPAKGMRPDTLLSQDADLTMPDLPCRGTFEQESGCKDNKFVDGVVVVNGVIVPGVGIVPLGITAGLDQPDESKKGQMDGKIDHLADSLGNAKPGHVSLYYAPPHDGLEGLPFVTIAIALDLEAFSPKKDEDEMEPMDSEFKESVVVSVQSTIIKVSDKFENDNLFTNNFVAYQGGDYNQQTHILKMNQQGDSDMYRLAYANGKYQWNVYTDAVPSELAMEKFKPASVSSDRLAELTLGAMNLNNGGLEKTVTYKDLIEFNATNIDSNFVYTVGAWSNSECEVDEKADDDFVPFCLKH